MARRLVTILAATCALLFVAVVTATIASFWRAPLWVRMDTYTEQSEVAGSWNRQYTRRETAFARGGFFYLRHVQTSEGLPHEADGAPQTDSRFRWFEDPDYPAPPVNRSLLWSFGFRIGDTDPQVFGFTIPVWPALVLLALVPVAWLASRVRERRAAGRLRLGHCPTCGYDLRASRERCPECGTAVAPS